MSNLTEAGFWKKLKKELKANKIKFQRFEDSLSEGIPDLCIFINGRTIWVELKNKKLPVRSSTCIKVGLRPLQRVWARNRLKDGVTVLTLTRLHVNNIQHSIVCHTNNVVDEIYFGCVLKRLQALGASFESEEEFVSLLIKMNKS